MSDEDITELKARINELEQNNEALWSWVKTLATQDAMLLELMANAMARREGWRELADKATDQIVNNSDIANGRPAQDG